MSIRRKVTEVRPVTTEREISREVKNYKTGNVLERVTIERRTVVTVFLECGHTREMQNGMRDITKSKSLDCFKCEQEQRGK